MLLVRAGHSPADDRNEYMGPQRCRGLDSTGHQQTRLLGDRLAHEQLIPAAIYHTDVARAEDTANIVSARLGRPPTTPALRCRNYGAADGALVDDVLAAFDPPLEQTPDRPLAPGADSWTTLTATVGRELGDILGRHVGDTVLVVCDEDTISASFQLYYGDSPSIAQTRRTANTGITEWMLTPHSDSKPGLQRWQGTVLRHNSLAHLPNSLVTPRSHRLAESPTPTTRGRAAHRETRPLGTLSSHSFRDAAD
ncbi:histidine phosphatase family protein [Nocardia abscessus]|uniref:histidine phosphatase family protein n=1 Tax=Nocardia abscessus TaxID=120957 RepID=UPI003A5CE5C5